MKLRSWRNRTRPGLRREIPRREWAAFCQEFSRERRGRPVIMKVFSADLGACAEIGQLSFGGIKFEAREEAEDQILITLGEAPEAEVTYIITAPSSVKLEPAGRGAPEALAIDSAGRTKTSIRFRSAVLPEIVDGTVLFYRPYDLRQGP